MQLKVLHVIPSLAKGGAERLVIDIGNEAKNRNDIVCKIVVLDPMNLYPKESQGLDLVCINYTLQLSIFRKDQVDVHEFDEIIRSFNPDVIHSHMFQADLISRYNIHPSVKYVSHFHGRVAQLEHFPSFGFSNKLSYTNLYERRLIQKQFRKCNNNYLVVSEDSKERIIKTTSYQASQLRVLHNAIDLDRFKVGAAKIPSSEIQLITIGRLVPDKNHVFLLEVVRLLRDDGFNCRLNILGEGEERERIQQRIVALGLEDFVTLLGNVSEPEVYLQKSDIYLHGSTHEPFGLVLLEAMACGIPVVTTNGGGNMAIIEAGFNALLDEERTPLSFKNAVESLIQNPTEYDRIKENGLAFVQNYSIVSYVDKLIEYYKEIDGSPKN